jgi:TraX protein.
LKWIALITMVVDHVGAIFLQGTAWYAPLRIIGRISFPIFAWQLALSWKKTRHPWRLAGLLLVFALVSQIPYSLAFQKTQFNIFALFLLACPGLALLRLGRRGESILVFVLCAVLAEVLQVTYGMYGIALIAAFALTGDSLLELTLVGCGMLVFALVAGLAWQWAAVGALPLIALYSGERGKHPLRAWFYLFYPCHLALFAGLRILLINPHI